MSLLFAVAILAWWRATRRPWSGLGLDRPRLVPIVAGFVFGVFLKLLLKAIVMPLLGAAPVNQAYHFLAGNAAALPGMIVTIVIVAGFGEEIVFRGFLFDRLETLWGRSRPLATVLASAALFALGHLADQGWDGARQAVITGLVFGAIYARTRSLWPLMAAHIAYDLVAIALIYAGLETRVAHLVW